MRPRWAGQAGVMMSQCMHDVPAAAEERPPVFVFTCGRTGSTLLIRMLNCLPDTIMWGEHNGSLKPLLNSYSRVRDVAGNQFVAQASQLLQPVYDRQPILTKPGMSIEWLNWFTEADIDRLYRDFIIGLFYPESVRSRFSRWGFKEIQYRDFELSVLRKLFPGMKAIILYRNPAAVFASQFRNFAKGDGERLPKIIKNIESFYQFAAAQAERQDEGDDRPLFISYEEIAGAFDDSVLKLQQFLEEEFSSSIEALAKDIVRFRKRRSPLKWSSNPLEDFDAWQRTTEVKVPRRRIQLMVDSYDAVLKATGAEQTATAGEPGFEIETSARATAQDL
jgi:hypothetical protein